ncbi:hypothetical protein BG004_006965 [Podila humilis]|nr:hypothetical protein BG004_006965 [Podila humilis]
MQHHEDPAQQDQQEQSESLVNIDLIVDDKENIQPIREGRSAQTLSHLFGAQLNERTQELQRRHEQFQRDIEQSEEDDDPLDIHVQYIHWIIENYPQSAGQGHDSNLLQALEQTMRTFQGDDRYRNDIRYVRLYVHYSGIVEDPDHIFKFMMANNIGTQLAMLYEEYAEYLEDMEDFVTAREILELGINRRAMPLGRLKKNRDEFEMRAQKFEEEAEKKRLDEAMLNDDPRQTTRQGQGAAAQRQVLGVKVSRTESIPSNSTSHGHVPMGSAAPSQQQQQQPQRTPIVRPRTKLAVYSDSTPTATSPTPSSSSASAGAGRSTVPRQDSTHHQNHLQRALEERWTDLSTERVRRKENTQEATPWQGVTLPSDNHVPKKIVRKLEVFRDVIPEPAAATATSTTVAETTSAVISPETKPLSTPIPHVAETKPRSARAPLPSQLRDIARVSGRFPIEISEDGKPERLMFDQKAIYDNGEEFSIEEIRARRYRAGEDSMRSIPIAVAYPVSTSPSDTPPRYTRKGTNNYHDSMLRSPSPDLFSGDDDDAYNQHHRLELMLPISEEQAERRKRIAEHRRRLRESPTIHMMEADAFMNKMFSSDYHHKKRKAEDDEGDIAATDDIPMVLSEEARAILEDPVPQSDSDDEHFGEFDGEDCGTMTMAIREMRRQDALEHRENVSIAFPADLTIAIAERWKAENA